MDRSLPGGLWWGRALQVEGMMNDWGWLGTGQAEERELEREAESDKPHKLVNGVGYFAEGIKSNVKQRQA